MKIKSLVALSMASLMLVNCSSTKKPVEAPLPIVIVKETRFFNSIWFANDSSEINGIFDSIIKLNANYLIAHPDAQIQIQGNASEVGTAILNQKLGIARATAIANALIASGANPQQIQTVSFGDTKPLFQELSKNRRADIIYINIAPSSYHIDTLPILTTMDETIVFDAQSVQGSRTYNKVVQSNASNSPDTTNKK